MPQAIAIPFFKVLTLWITASPVEVLDVIDIQTYYILVYFSRVMFYINSAINPILYNIMSSKFRAGFRRVFYCFNWPLSPRRLRLSSNARPTSSTNAEWPRSKTVTSSLMPKLELQSNIELSSGIVSKHFNFDKLPPYFRGSFKYHDIRF